MLTRKTLGARIAAARGAAGMTQAALAAALGLERSAVARIEAGDQGVDTLRLSKIAEALGADPALFFRDEERDPVLVLLRAPEASREDVAAHLEWLRRFVDDYELLRRLTAEGGAS